MNKIKMVRSILPILILIVFAVTARAQDSFHNLDFESATISQTQSIGLVDSADALPHWSAFSGTNTPLAQVGFKAQIAGTPIALFATNGLTGTSIEGGFSVYLVGAGVDYPGGPLPFVPAASITQTGLVPATAQCVVFKARPGTSLLVLSLGGQAIPFVAVARGSNYNLYAGDVAPFVGQSLELRFTVGYRGTGWNLDSIAFTDQTRPALIPNHLDIGMFFDAIQLSFFAESNNNYNVEYVQDITNTDWVTIGPDIVGTGTTRVIFDTVTNSVSRRFYRLFTY